MYKLATVFLLAVGCCANTFASAAITAPYSNDFSSIVPPADEDFSPTLNGQWSVVGEKYRNQILSTPSEEKTSTSMLQFSNLGGSPLTANDFFLSTTFIVDPATVGTDNSIGFAVLGNSANATTNSSSHYIADVFLGSGTMNFGKLRFAEIGMSTTYAMTDGSLGKVLQPNTPYTLELEGKYDENGALKMKLGLIDGLDYDTFETISIPAANVLNGNYFGFRNRASGGATSTLSVELDNLNIVAIPEPSSIGFVATSLIAGYAIGMYIRRRMPSSMV